MRACDAAFDVSLGEATPNADLGGSSGLEDLSRRRRRHHQVVTGPMVTTGFCRGMRPRGPKRAARGHKVAPRWPEVVPKCFQGAP